MQTLIVTISIAVAIALYFLIGTALAGLSIRLKFIGKPDFSGDLWGDNEYHTVTLIFLWPLYPFILLCLLFSSLMVKVLEETAGDDTQDQQF